MKAVNYDFLKIDDASRKLNHIIRIGSVRDSRYFVAKRLVANAGFLI